MFSRSRRGGARPLPPGFGTIWTAVAVDLVGFGIVFPLLPLYAEDPRFSASPFVATMLVASFSAAQLVFSPILGRASDRFGRKPLLVLSLFGTAIGSLLTGLAWSLPVLFVGRILDGVSGSSVAVAQAAVADVADPADRPRLMGLLGAAFGLGFVAGPAIGALAALGDHRLPFLVAAVIAAGNAVLAIRRLPETAGRRAQRADPAGRPAPVAALIWVSFAALVAFSAFETTFALFAFDRLGLDLAGNGAVFAAVGVALVAVQGGLVRPVVDRLGEAGTLRAGLAINAVGLLLVAIVEHLWQLVPALGLLALGQGLAMPAVTSAVAGRAAMERRGGTLGIQQAAGGLARVIGPLAGGLLFSRVGESSPYVAGALLTAACAVAAGSLPAIRRSAPAAP